MSSRIGGPLDMAALSAPAGTTPDTARMRHFAALDQQRQAEAIQRLAATGMSDHGIAHATGLAVEAVNQLLTSGCAAGDQHG